jgi:hypothetical protein
MRPLLFAPVIRRILICENVPTFVPRNTTLAGVPLAANGDFKIDLLCRGPPALHPCC